LIVAHLFLDILLLPLLAVLLGVALVHQLLLLAPGGAPDGRGVISGHILRQQISLTPLKNPKNLSFK